MQGIENLEMKRVVTKKGNNHKPPQTITNDHKLSANDHKPQETTRKRPETTRNYQKTTRNHQQATTNDQTHIFRLLII